MGFKNKNTSLKKIMERKIGRGNKTLFSKDNWIGKVGLECKYPRLYLNSTNKDEEVESMGESV